MVAECKVASLNQIVIKTARIEGFLVRDYMHEYEESFLYFRIGSYLTS